MKKARKFLMYFLKLWFFMFFSLVTVKTIFNLLYFGWIDLRRATLFEIVFIPLGQSTVFWLITRKREKGD